MKLQALCVVHRLSTTSSCPFTQDWPHSLPCSFRRPMRRGWAPRVGRHGGWCGLCAAWLRRPQPPSWYCCFAPPLHADLCDVHHPEPVDVVSQPKIQIMQAGGWVAMAWWSPPVVGAEWFAGVFVRVWTGRCGGPLLPRATWLPASLHTGNAHKSMRMRSEALTPTHPPTFQPTIIMLAQPVFRDFGGNLRFRGQAATVKCFEVWPACLLGTLAAAPWCCVVLCYPCCICATATAAGASSSSRRSNAEDHRSLMAVSCALIGGDAGLQANPLVRAALEEQGKGRVLVVDGGASMR